MSGVNSYSYVIDHKWCSKPEDFISPSGMALDSGRLFLRGEGVALSLSLSTSFHSKYVGIIGDLTVYS